MHTKKHTSEEERRHRANKTDRENHDISSSWKEQCFVPILYYYFTIYPSFQHSFKRDVSHHVFLLNYLLDLCRGMLNSVLLGYHYNMKVCQCLHVYYMFYIPKNKRCRHLYVFVPRSNLANKGSNTFLYKLLEKLQGETTQFSSQFGGGSFVFY